MIVSMSRRSYQRSYTELRYLITESLQGCADYGEAEVSGNVRRIADGIWHDNYWFWIEGRDLPSGRTECPLILRLLERRYDWQQGTEPRERLIREAKTLQVLKGAEFPHPSPEFICFVEDASGEPIGMIETVVPGDSLEHHKDLITLKLVSRVAAAVHGLSGDLFSHLPSDADRSKYVSRQLEKLDHELFTEFPLASDVREWIQAHLPPADPNCVLHGDLLPQNLLSDWRQPDRENASISVIDWEMAHIGDPAYDLAIVSRGNRKVLGVSNGLKILVEEYLQSGGKQIALRDVHVHELLLVLHWLEESWKEYQKPAPNGHGPDFYVDKLRPLFRRVTG